MLLGEKEHDALIELKEKYKVPIFTLEEILFHCEPAGRGYLTKEAMLAYACMPIGCESLYQEDDSLCVVISAELTSDEMNNLKGMSGKKIIVAAVALKENVYAAINQLANRGKLEAKEKTLGELSRKYGVPIVDLNEYVIEPEVVRLVPQEFAIRNLCFPFGRVDEGRICVAVADPSDIKMLDEVKFATGENIEVCFSAEDDIRAAIEKWAFCFKKEGVTCDDVMENFIEDEVEFGAKEPDVVDLERSAEDAPIVRLVNMILMDGIRRNASHIHVEPYEKDFRVRLRIDGVLYEVMRPPMSLKNGIISRIKILAEMDITNRQTPQIGKIKLRLGKGREKDISVSTFPTSHGEKIMLKILHKSDEKINDLLHLGLEADQYELLRTAVKKSGLILIAGPHDSGKNTTMKMLAQELNKTTANIVVVGGNDWSIPWINHTDSLDALNNAVRHQDADVIVIGKLDERSLQIAMKSGAMGKKVIAGIDYCGDAAEVVSMLANLGAPRYQIVNSVNFIVSQRLVRCLCLECEQKATEQQIEAILKSLGWDVEETIETKANIHLPGQGCRNCSQTTFKGRTGIFEILTMTADMREIISNGADAKEIRAQAKKDGMMTLFNAGCEKVYEGVVSNVELLAMDLVK
ncbi:MAG: ATPase, T2SS/T4P/T4SS family [Parcubacteria group bacterium]